MKGVIYILKNPSFPDYVKMQYLFNGEVNTSVVAWKTGQITEGGKPKKNNNGDYLNGYGRKISADALEEYLDSFTDDVNDKINQLILEGKYQDAYEIALNPGKEVPYNFGSIYIINLLFFISKGTLPIYDKFAHKALLALSAENIAPRDIKLKDVPSKSEAFRVVSMYTDYLDLAKSVFGEKALRDNVEKNGYTNRNMFISRELDQALWVYGHADKVWDNKEN